MSETGRQLARQIFAEAMAATTVEAACARALIVHGNTLVADGRSYDLTSFSSIQIVSIGKAGATLFDAVRSLLPQFLPVRAILSAPAPPNHKGTGDLYFQGGHPLPNAASLDAAEAALELLNTADAETLVIFLVSGGASAMLEKPISPSISLPDLIEFNRQLVGSGASIRQINTVRKHLSAVKGGRLAAAASHATKLSLFLSDVPDEALDALASGPTLPDSTTLHQCRTIVTEYRLESSLPESIRDALFGPLEETPKSGHPAFRNAHNVVLLDNAALLRAASNVAQRLGFEVVIDNSCDDWDYQEAAAYLLQRAEGLASQHKLLCLLSGGEVTVRLPANSGAGGRNQQLCLFAARALQDSEDITFLSAGSDGIDGNSPAAGCVADETTWRRAEERGLGPESSLRDFDAYPLFSALGDSIVTGPSGNDLRDLRILLSGASLC
jgi:glycerate 2-kinase